MSFGRNPHVAKAEAAEQKALTARDELAREQAFREAARLWERASERETDLKRRQEYLDKAESARTNADRIEQDSMAAKRQDRVEIEIVTDRAGGSEPKLLN